MSSAERHPQELLLAYMDKELAGAELARTAEHVEGCDSCRAWCEAYEALEHLEAAPAGAGPHPGAGDLVWSVLTPEELDEGTRREVETHLAGCEQCGREARIVAAGAESTGWRALAAGSAGLGYLTLAASLLLVVGLAASIVWLGIERSGQVPVHRHVENVTLTGDRVIESETDVEVVDTQISGGSEITLRAGELVALGNGFSVADGASLSVEIRLPERDDLDSG